MSQTNRGVVLFAHGSRDPLWRQPMDTVAERMRALAPGTAVTCAFLELCQPDLQGAVRGQVAAGAQHIRIVPMFLGVGRHARQDLPLLVQALQADHPRVHFELQPAIGEQPEVVEVMARIALMPTMDLPP